MPPPSVKLDRTEKADRQFDVTLILVSREERRTVPVRCKISACVTAALLQKLNKLVSSVLYLIFSLLAVLAMLNGYQS